MAKMRRIWLLLDLMLSCVMAASRSISGWPRVTVLVVAFSKNARDIGWL